MFTYCFFLVSLALRQSGSVCTVSADNNIYGSRIKDQLDITCYFISFHFLCAQHVSDISISIIRSLRQFCWITTLVVLFLVRCVLEIRCGWVGVLSVFKYIISNYHISYIFETHLKAMFYVMLFGSMLCFRNKFNILDAIFTDAIYSY